MKKIRLIILNYIILATCVQFYSMVSAFKLKLELGIGTEIGGSKNDFKIKECRDANANPTMTGKNSYP